MLKRVTRILDRQQKLADELRELMPKQYVPGPGESWDYPKNLEAWGDDLTRSWRKAVFEIGWVPTYVEDLVILLEMKVERIEQNANREAVETANDSEELESSEESADGPVPHIGEVPNGQSGSAGQDSVHVALS
jgi:hypothetical protein